MSWILAVDVGNTVTRLGVVAAGEVQAGLRVPTAAADYADLLRRGLARLAPSEPPAAAGVCSVVPGRQGLVEETVAGLGAPPVVVGPEAAGGLTIAYEAPETLGPDRIANALAAWERFRGACIAVDLGTALSLEAVDGRGALLGGALFPGIRAARAALEGAAARPIPAPRGRTWRAIGRDTGEAVAAGSGFGFPGLIEGLVAATREELGVPAPAVLTGGGVRGLARWPVSIDACDRHLTLRGTALAAARSAGKNCRHPGA
ncbi:MAG TPA: type III pantothenate kinase [Gammaproteobacteria bacterium]|nr:type III pantothenate kinase [Gammaproteobacteria bacterium]